MKENHPVASLERIKELHLDPAIYPACGPIIQVTGPTTGRKTVQKGCKWYEWKDGQCPWRDNTQHMQARDAGDVKPRPRHLRTRFVKPDPNGGPGDIVIDNYCACFRWHEGLSKRNRKNRELARVIGGEGDTVTLKTSKRVLQADNSVVYEEDYKEVVIPRFPDPTENKDMKQDVFAAKAKAQVEGEAFVVDEADEARRLGVQPNAPAVEGATPVEMNDVEARRIAGVS